MQIQIQFSFQSNRTKVSFMFVLRQSHGHMLLNTITSSTERRKRWPYFSMRSFSIMHWFWSTIWSSKRKMGAIHSFSWANRSFTLSLTKTSDSLEKPMSEFPTLEKGRHSDSLYSTSWCFGVEVLRCVQLWQVICHFKVCYLT